MTMTREQAQNTAGDTSPLYRPLSLGTMAILQRIDNPVLAAMMTGAPLTIDYESFLVFLYIHARENNLATIREEVENKTLTEQAYSWLDNVDTLTLAEGVDYFTQTQTRIQLLSATNAEKNTEKKNGASPHGITHVKACLMYYYNITLAEVESMPYPVVLQYIHSLLILNGNATRWANEDTAQAEKDNDLIKSLDL